MSSEESTAPAGREGADAPLDDPADGASTEATTGDEPKKAKKAKKVKEPKAPKPPKEPKEPKAKKEKAPKEPKATKEPKPPKEPKAKKEKAPKPAKVKTPRRGRKGGDPVDDVADDELEIGWSTGDGATGDGLTGDATSAVDTALDDGAEAEPDTGESRSPAKRRTLVGAAAIGPLLLVGALFLPTDRGRHGATAMAAPTTVPAEDGSLEEPAATEPTDATPRFLVTVEQDLPATTTTASPTTTAAGHGEAGHTATSAGHDTAGHEAAEGATASTTKRSSTRTTAPPPFVVTQFDREDTQLAVFALLDGRKIELAVPVRYFHLVSVSDPAQQTFDKEVAGHLLVVDRDGRYWGADLQAVPALLYQLPSSKPLDAPATTAPADGTPHGTTTTTIHAGGHPATGTTAHESTVHEDAEVALTTPGSTEHEIDHTTDHAATTEGHTATGVDESAHDGTTHDETAGTDGAETDEAVAEPTTTTRVREPFPLVVNGPVSDEDERVVRLLAALPGVTSVLDLGRGAVLVEGDVDLEAILNVPGVLAAQPATA